MRILYHHRTLGDGAEGIHMAEMVTAFRRLGHDVHVLGLAGHGSVAREGLVRRIRNVLPRPMFEIASVASNAADYLDVRRAISNIQPDFLYKRHARYDVGALYAAQHARIPAVLEVNCLFTGRQYHQFEPLALNALAARLERRALSLPTAVLAVSTPLSRDIDATARIRSVVLPNGADPERFDPMRANPDGVRSRYGLRDALTVGWAGVVREWHGLELLLEALVHVPAAHLLIVGDGPARPAFAQRAAALGVGERVVITGRVPHAEMPDHLAAMDIAVVASDLTGVASPMKLVEYMAMGRAVVAPRLDNIRDLVTDDSNGLLFTADDSASLADVLRRLAGDSALRVRLGRNARLTVELERNWRRNAERVLMLVERSTNRPQTLTAGTVVSK